MKISRFLTAGLVAGVIAAAINVAWSLGYGAATGVSHPLVAAPNVIVSSLAPPLIGALAWYGLARVTPKAGLVSTVLALGLGGVSIAVGFLQLTLPDGTPKPPGFQGLVQPMHAVVPLVFSATLPRWLARGR